MEEKKVTIGDKTLDLPLPFIVFATQNPLEHEGTYPLPEAELDRFLMKIVLDYPSRADEKRIFIQETGTKTHTDTHTNSRESNHISETEQKSNLSVSSVSVTATDILEMIDYIASNIHVDENIYEYVGDLLTELRKLTKPPEPSAKYDASSLKNGILSYGPSTRAGLALIRA